MSWRVEVGVLLGSMDGGREGWVKGYVCRFIPCVVRSIHLGHEGRGWVPPRSPTLERGRGRGGSGLGWGLVFDRSSPWFPPSPPSVVPIRGGGGVQGGVAILGGRGGVVKVEVSDGIVSVPWCRIPPHPHPPSIHPSILHPLGRGPFTTHVVRHPTHVAPLRAPHLPRASERGWWEVAGRGGEPGKERGGYTQPQPYTHVNQVLAAEPHLSSGRPEAVVETETKPWNTPGGSEVVRNKAKGRTCSPARR